MSTADFSMSLESQIACVRREIAMRERVYPKWVAAGKMKPEKSQVELATMRAVLDTLLKLHVEHA